MLRRRVPQQSASPWGLGSLETQASAPERPRRRARLLMFIAGMAILVSIGAAVFAWRIGFTLFNDEFHSAASTDEKSVRLRHQPDDEVVPEPKSSNRRRHAKEGPRKVPSGRRSGIDLGDDSASDTPNAPDRSDGEGHREEEGERLPEAVWSVLCGESLGHVVDEKCMDHCRESAHLLPRPTLGNACISGCSGGARLALAEACSHEDKVAGLAACRLIFTQRCPDLCAGYRLVLPAPRVHNQCLTSCEAAVESQCEALEDTKPKGSEQEARVEEDSPAVPVDKADPPDEVRLPVTSSDQASKDVEKEDEGRSNQVPEPHAPATPHGPVLVDTASEPKGGGIADQVAPQPPVPGAGQRTTAEASRPVPPVVQENTRTDDPKARDVLPEESHQAPPPKLKVPSRQEPLSSNPAHGIQSLHSSFDESHPIHQHLRDQLSHRSEHDRLVEGALRDRSKALRQQPSSAVFPPLDGLPAHTFPRTGDLQPGAASTGHSAQAAELERRRLVDLAMRQKQESDLLAHRARVKAIHEANQQQPAPQ
uniref:Uncharacterized protein n=1 Tax=Rhizochromulina marina TaxID=1034831 RepID=A0A7S2SQD9_9STRA|mmetsp:Transcript_409/g.1349  ORF Transcript_409/g.1349 Transcript_409/m.1349 type:complete len:537 (+) Transcript_409:87-1697(+)|eukprot:CAMPEP_0118985520 /NCGR_PEP_ID=MMETSP1173-20130426/40161_1 /TAXON_ID=1034831 /ORGANISM="Rhizochromulina marina cf, Strain CCMP1243" /LENGTH=536 /DNA_ID=CAMNT_0006936249 /DNA_START=64 /DNA_END=1674 /DNA_ORIENTATION=-